MKDDIDAVNVISKAIAALSEYYKINKIPLNLVQKNEDSMYSVDEDKAPEANFSAGSNRGQETGGIIDILEMVREDTEHEIKTSREEEAEAEAGTTVPESSDNVSFP